MRRVEVSRERKRKKGESRRREEIKEERGGKLGVCDTMGRKGKKGREGWQEENEAEGGGI